MQCPTCSSPTTIKNGHTRGKQRYKCKACGHQFVEAPQPVGAPPKGTAPPCLYCDVGILHKRSERKGHLYYQCRNPECRRFSTYKLDDRGELERVLTPKAQKSQAPAPKTLDFFDWLDLKRLSRRPGRVIGEATDRSANFQDYALQINSLHPASNPPIFSVVYWQCPSNLSASRLFVGILETVRYRITKGNIAELRERVYRVLQTCQVEMLILDEAQHIPQKVLPEICDISDHLEISVVLAGNDRLDRLLKRDEQNDLRFLIAYRFSRANQ
jgi:Bacterial TniB protein